MANHRRGEYSFTLNGTEFLLRFDMNALAELEGVLDDNLSSIIARMQEKPSFRFLRAALYAGLLHDKRFKRDNATLERIGNMLTIENFGDITRHVMIALGSALSGKSPSELEKMVGAQQPEKIEPEARDGNDPFEGLTGIRTE